MIVGWGQTHRDHEAVGIAAMTEVRARSSVHLLSKMLRCLFEESLPALLRALHEQAKSGEELLYRYHAASNALL